MLLAAMFLLAACNWVSSEPVVGTYVNHSEGEYSIADDTLSVSEFKEGQWKVERRTGFNLIREGVVARREFETEEWTLVYDEHLSAYRQLERGKIIRYDAEAKVLHIGNREYRKINNKI
jgi:hypothetical protein